MENSADIISTSRNRNCFSVRNENKKLYYDSTEYLNIITVIVHKILPYCEVNIMNIARKISPILYRI